MKVRYDPHCPTAALLITVSSLGSPLAGVEVCTQGGTELPRVETPELSRPEAVAVPGAEHPGHDGPGRAVHTESGLARKRGREFHGGRPGRRGQ